MYLIYFDEAKDDKSYPHYHLAGIAVREESLGEVEERVRALSVQVFGSADLGPRTEFHAAEIYHRKGHFKEWRDFEKRVGVLGELLQILSLESVRLIDVQINCEKLRGNQSADEIAFMFLCERANDLMKANKSMGMLIGDRESDHHSARYATALSSYRAEGTEFEFGREIKNLVDSVHFTHSHLSRFLQLADTYVWTQQFLNRNRESEDIRHAAIRNLLRDKSINLSPSKYKEWPK